MNSYIDAKVVDEDMLNRYLPLHSPEGTARAMVRSTTLRERELYYPPQHNIYIQCVIRVAFPSLLEWAMDQTTLS